MSPSPEREARQNIDAALEAAGWAIQDRATMNLTAAPGVAVREFKMAPGHGFADYLLFVNGKAVGALEAKLKSTRDDQSLRHLCPMQGCFVILLTRSFPRSRRISSTSAWPRSLRQLS